jgi:hypothetical protein
MDLLNGYGSDSSDSSARPKQQQNPGLVTAAALGSHVAASRAVPNAMKLPPAASLFDAEGSDESDGEFIPVNKNSATAKIVSNSPLTPVNKAGAASSGGGSGKSGGQKRTRAATAVASLTPTHVLRKKSNVSTEDTECVQEVRVVALCVH